ncbi:chalcone isomerase family protein [Undibacterium sp. RuTC16W]|uniref:chalcone isomerase family protein n=1 Tax=Undibacterium sp. RuTC16W TaxID=3413048 RepID=UPI003BF35C1E
MTTSNYLVQTMRTACIALFLSLTAVPAAHAGKDPVPATLEETQQLDGQTLLLNGSGPHVIKRVKIFNIGIYTPKLRTTSQELLASTGPIRIKLVMLKEVESELMSRRFLADIRSSTTKEERNQLVHQLLALGEGFATIGDWKVGDVMTIDWTRGKGTVFRSNNKQIGETLKDDLTMQAILKIWLGENVADNKLKRLLLGDKE